MADDPRLGPNSWLVEEMYERWQASPTAVDDTWQALFAVPVRSDGEPVQPADPSPELDTPTERDPAPPDNGISPPKAASASTVPPEAASVSTVPPEAASASTAPPTAASDNTEPGEPLRGAAARIVANMTSSLEVPTATSYRHVPAKLLEVNRRTVNEHLVRALRPKVSFTHFIAYAIVRAVATVPAMSRTFATGSDDAPRVVTHDHVGLGIAVDVERRDGTRSLLVPTIARADEMPFDRFVAAYEDLVERGRTGRVGVDELTGATLSITNVGTLGTAHSVPRLMAGQAAIVGVGAIGYPAEYAGADPQRLVELGVSRTVTISNTYDHRVVQGAESGLFLQRVHDLLLGEDGFYDHVFEALDVPHEPARWQRDVNPVTTDVSFAHKQMQVRKLVQMHRVRGHLIADLDPLDAGRPEMHPELDPATYGLTVWDLEREFLTDDMPGPDTMPLGDILDVLRSAYCERVGVEYMHIQETAVREWIQARVETPAPRPDREGQRHLLELLSEAEAFERFLHQRYVGHKRFGLEGAESAIVILDTILSAAADDGLSDAVLGMAHRGRLNVLSNIMGQSNESLFRQLEGHLDEDTIQGTGDVKYHVGASTTFESRAGNRIPVRLAANPSHLEAVDPVVIGMVRALQDHTEPAGSFPVLPLLVHGDAAFAGQGVVAETLNLSNIPGYRVGGTVHLVIDNQVGYTTPPGQARSSLYCTDVAKMVQAPVLHVNGDDPEACARVGALAVQFRERFHTDVVVRLVGYRRHGHNEGDDPSYTQPLMYSRIEAKRSVRELYTETLVRRGDISADEARQELEAFEGWLQSVLDETRAAAPESGRRSVPPAPFVGDFSPVPTGAPIEVLDAVAAAIAERPDGFATHPKLARQLDARVDAYHDGEVDWGLAELLAYGSILLDGGHVRLCGQDTRRGTFAHRHAVAVDHVTEAEYFPLRNLGDRQGRFFSYDSMLSEYAAMGVEYGYSVVQRDTLVLWEAQFGDFANGAQVIIDQFLAAGSDKWDQDCGLVLLLPHGFEGQGPEHSSARIERFLTLCAEGNMCVAQPTTAAQLFHLLRRQRAGGNRRPLVVFTPKSLLRSPSARSHTLELTEGSFREVIDDDGADRAAVREVVLCTGKIGHEAIARRNEADRADIAVVRVEQLYPWPQRQISAVLDRYRGTRTLTWLQEEPSNMGAWTFARSRLDEECPTAATLRLVARPESGSPACGSVAVHADEAGQLLSDLFGAGH